jgi:hypothetical protein
MTEFNIIRDKFKKAQAGIIREMNKRENKIGKKNLLITVFLKNPLIKLFSSEKN